MEKQIINALGAIILGVGVLAAYFYGTNRLLDWLIPNYDDKKIETKPTPTGFFARFSLPDILVLVFGVILAITFFVTPWVSIKTDHGNIHLKGGQFVSLRPEKFLQPGETEIIEIADILGMETDAVQALSNDDTLKKVITLSRNVKTINGMFQLVILGTILTGAWGIIDRSRQRIAGFIALHLSLFGLLYYIFLNIHLNKQGYSFLSNGGWGSIIAIAALVGLFAQIFLPRLPILDYSRSIRLREAARPWVFVGPALVLLTLYLVYPAVQTTVLSFYNASATKFVGIRNYKWAFNDSEFLQSIRNNLLWLMVVPFFSTALGLIIAVLADRVRWGSIAKSFIFMPMAISFIGASVIWKFMYDFRGEGIDQIGLLNGIVVFFGGSPQAWITINFWNNFFLMAILIWIETGFAMVLLSAALRGVPEETIEAARIDGAGEIQIFFRVMIPQIMSTIAVVMTTITIVVLKIFDIVLAMTNGQWDTEVLANMMYDWMFRGGGDFGRGSMIAVVIMIAVIPIMIWNIRRFQAEEAMR